MDGIVMIAIAILAIVVGAAIALSLLIGAVVVWPLSLILILLGGFVFGGTGALVGGALAGVAGVFVYNQR